MIFDLYIYFCTKLFLYIFLLRPYDLLCISNGFVHLFRNVQNLSKPYFIGFSEVIGVLYKLRVFCFSVPKLQMPYLQAFSCFLQNPKPVLSLILSLDKTIGCRTFPPSDCLKMFKLLPEGIKNPCIFHSHGKMITGSGYATPAWGR